MHFVRNVTRIAALALLALGCQTARPPDNHAARLDALFQSLHERGLFDGAVVVADERGVLFEKGFGFANAEHQVRFTPDTPADGGSLAKTFTASLVLMLADEGMLHLDLPVQRLLPELPYPQISLRHLLSHSSGIPVLDYDYFDPFVPAAEIRTTERLLRVIGEQKPPLLFAPGTAFEYSSFGFDLAALAAARATDRSYEALLNERFFVPLGMTSAFLRPGRLAEFPGVRTLGYRTVAGSRKVHDVFDYEAFHGGSNIYVSARDLHRWNESFQRPVPAATKEPARIGDGRSGLTLGSWYHAPGGKAFWYSGHLQGFHDEVFRDASGTSIVYVSNNTIEPWLQKAVIRAVRTVLRGETPQPLVAPATSAVAKHDRASLAGRWRMGDGTEVTIENEETRLLMVRDAVRYRMVQVAPDTFYVPGLDAMVGFARSGAESTLSRIHIASNLEEHWGERAH